MPPEEPEAAGPPWLRLDPRMLVIGPLGVARQLGIPAAVAIGATAVQKPLLVVVLLPFALLALVAVGVLPWLTVRYRVTATQLQRRQGLLNRSVVTAPLDRVRSVDLEASLVHRVLGLTTVKVGTGVDETRIELDALAVGEAERLRERLLRRSAVPSGSADAAGAASPAAVELARIDWSWLRFAPFNLTQLVVVAGVLGAIGQFGDDLAAWSRVEGAWEGVVALALPVLVLLALVVPLLAWVVLAVAEYVVRWWDLRLTREAGNLRLSAGLLTTRSVTVEEERVRGVVLREPILLRWVEGATLATIATGVEKGVTTILPACPRGVAVRVGSDVLTDPVPLEVALATHGAPARRRAHVRAMVPVAVLAVAVAVVVLMDLVPVWTASLVLAAAALLGVVAGELTYRHLGHRLTARHLVAGSGTWSRVRDVLESDGVIGWVLSATWFQRRVGLVTLTATTAAGAERVVVRDVPRAQAVAVAEAVTPELAQFVG